MLLLIIVFIIAAIVIIVIGAHNSWIKNCLDDAGPFGSATGLTARKRLGILHLTYVWNEKNRSTETDVTDFSQKQEPAPLSQEWLKSVYRKA
ncbi:hypothetical protein JP09_007130 [Dehalogenimonas etheniformans]|uniref:Uncharacterized protein n=1 Tax=Dehalogenimonas etheniformans TaxID=1536648 RepID=A0A2P5P6Y6_9CHLR|nr:hypothetical protein JP09_007130 [Dehalogenimonas etheniformans]